MEILVIAICYNEKILAPHFLKHYEKFCSKLLIYNNHSTDDSIEILKKSSKSEIVCFDSSNTLNDQTHIDIKNEVWKKYKHLYDWIICIDFDEFLYHPDLLNFLIQCKNSGITIPRPTGFTMVGTSIPSDESNLLVEYSNGFKDGLYSKNVIFDPKKIESINYLPGCHGCNPRGSVTYIDDPNLKLLHYRVLSKEYYINRNKMMVNRFSDANKKYGWGFHLKQTDEYFSNHYQSMLNSSSKVI